MDHRMSKLFFDLLCREIFLDKFSEIKGISWNSNEELATE
jgi:hypothetical protein